MKLGIMQPYFFPYIGYWQLLNYVDEYIIFDDVNYTKRGWINRNRILFDGQPRYINLHIKNASLNKLIKNTMLAQTEKDNLTLLSTIKQGYRKAPYFEQTYSLIEKLLANDSDCLADYLFYQIKEICKYLNIQTRIISSSEIKKNSELKGEEKIIDICVNRNARSYVNSIGGKELYHQERFLDQGLTLQFLKPQNISYQQYRDVFIPNLSIIDVMMFNDKDVIQEFLDRFDLEE